MKSKFCLFSSHLDLAHNYWKALLSPSDRVIDATCGNGHDTLQLAKCVPEGQIIAFDIQKEAIDHTNQLLKENLSLEALSRITVINQSHETFPLTIQPGTIKLIVYNLGYLPGHNKSFTTETSSTLKSLQNALPLIMPGGVISITCYPGHPEGAKEEIALLDMGATLNPQIWSVCHHKILNRASPPSLLLIQKYI